MHTARTQAHTSVPRNVSQKRPFLELNETYSSIERDAPRNLSQKSSCNIGKEYTPSTCVPRTTPPTHPHTHTHTHTPTHTHHITMHARMHACIRRRVHARLHWHTQAYAGIRRHTHTYAHIRTHTHLFEEEFTLEQVLNALARLDVLHVTRSPHMSACSTCPFYLTVWTDGGADKHVAKPPLCAAS